MWPSVSDECVIFRHFSKCRKNVKVDRSATFSANFSPWTIFHGENVDHVTRTDLKAIDVSWLISWFLSLRSTSTQSIYSSLFFNWILIFGQWPLSPANGCHQNFLIERFNLNEVPFMSKYPKVSTGMKRPSQERGQSYQHHRTLQTSENWSHSQCVTTFCREVLSSSLTSSV